jgi:hypothetical protein
LKFSDNIPDAFRAAIFKLNQGETTEPLKQPNGYYLLRADEVIVKPLKDVRDDIYNDLECKVARLDGQAGPRNHGAGKPQVRPPEEAVAQASWPALVPPPILSAAGRAKPA